MKVSTGYVEAMVVSEQLRSMALHYREDPELGTEAEAIQMETLAGKIEESMREARVQLEITEEEHTHWYETIQLMREGWEWQTPWIDEV